MQNNSGEKSEMSLVANSDFENYLKNLGLPAERILASRDERNQISVSLPTIIERIPPEVRNKANYLSKFISSVAIGRFDSALNDLWNEVVTNLHNKICLYGIDIFFDSAIGDNLRDQYNDENDLKNIKDRVLLDTCVKLEIITDIVYQKLVHILNMRNNISSAHPNNGQIQPFELLGWLQTCTVEVISVEPSAGALEVKKFISNLRAKKSSFIQSDIVTIKESINNLSSMLCGNILKTIFGMFTDVKIEKVVKENILAIAPAIWCAAKEEYKYDLGVKLEGFIVNLEEEKKALAETFFEKCDGFRFKPDSRKSLELTILSDDLMNAHNGWDNFKFETPIIRNIMKYIKTSEDIPLGREENLIRNILLCRIGKSHVEYCGGVSPSAISYYDEFFKLLSGAQIMKLFFILKDPIVINELDSNNTNKNFGELLSIIDSSTLNDRAKEILNYLKNNSNISFAKKISATTFSDLINR
ncbi:hypothetical protein R0H03_01855 [Pediococcus acidilactici]|uniref:Uncharacterized protein n=1 Tax=Pediococcus acidilactici TaxID=1254 RepID=A0AAW8YKG8_PEDAC|nr:hypothetical protein [Pediococcus acidilactici]MDV2910615.1 hypothetical protein [Pediococcus acidilactici]WQS17926.1 hypothetical protein SGW14_02440 [Pediococcus acidilactici]